MIICLCNPFSDKKVKTYLENSGNEKASVSEVYDICSDGQTPQCCSCLETLKDMVDAHNHKIMLIAAE